MPSKFELDKPTAIGLKHTGFYYANCMWGGVLACGVTHASVVTLDVAKCRSQAHSKSGKWPGGLLASIKETHKVDGIKGMRKGWVPTFFGYGAQGLFKFGLNEVFKDIYSNMLGAEALESKPMRMAMWAAASGSAEIFADIALCPFEMTKVKMQVTLTGEPGGVPSKLLPAMKEMNRMKVDTKFPFGSLVPLWGRQIPYTMIKFVGFYLTQEQVYKVLLNQTGKQKEEFSTFTQLSITFGCGYWAGIFCAVSTQPMDNLVSMKGNPAYKDVAWGAMAKEMGAKDLFLKGLGARVLMIGTLTGLQWWIYGSWKNFCGFGTS